MKSKEMRACIDECLRCYQTCLGTAMTQCLEAGGEHVAPALPADDGLLRDVPYSRALHASQFASPCARLRGVRGDLHGMRQGLRAHRRDGRLRDGVSSLCRELPRDGELIGADYEAGWNILA